MKSIVLWSLLSCLLLYVPLNQAQDEEGETTTADTISYVAGVGATFAGLVGSNPLTAIFTVAAGIFGLLGLFFSDSTSSKSTTVSSVPSVSPPPVKDSEYYEEIMSKFYQQQQEIFQTIKLQTSLIINTISLKIDSVVIYEVTAALQEIQDIFHQPFRRCLMNKTAGGCPRRVKNFLVDTLTDETSSFHVTLRKIINLIVPTDFVFDKKQKKLFAMMEALYELEQQQHTDCDNDESLNHFLGNSCIYIVAVLTNAYSMILMGNYEHSETSSQKYDVYMYVQDTWATTITDVVKMAEYSLLRASWDLRKCDPPQWFDNYATLFFTDNGRPPSIRPGGFRTYGRSAIIDMKFVYHHQTREVHLAAKVADFFSTNTSLNASSARWEQPYIVKGTGAVGSMVILNQPIQLGDVIGPPDTFLSGYNVFIDAGYRVILEGEFYPLPKSQDDNVTASVDDGYQNGWYSNFNLYSTGISMRNITKVNWDVERGNVVKSVGKSHHLNFKSLGDYIVPFIETRDVGRTENLVPLGGFGVYYKNLESESLNPTNHCGFLAVKLLSTNISSTISYLTTAMVAKFVKPPK